jgi:glycosyltransferase involved in cell wall biosynthesis
VKILVLNNAYPPDRLDGYEVACRQAADALAARGHDVRVLTSVPRRPLPAEPHFRRLLRLTDVWDTYLQSRQAEVSAHLALAEARWINSANVHSLIVELNDFQPDVVYVWMLEGLGGLGLLTCLSHLRVPWVWHLIGNALLPLCTLAGQVVPTFLNEFLRHLPARFLVSGRQAVETIKLHGLDLTNQCDAVPCWVTGPAPAPRRPFDRAAPLRIVTVAGQGVARSNAGAELLIEMAAHLRARGHERFSIDVFTHIGDAHLPNLIRHFGVSAQVALKGERTPEQLARLYPDYDLYALANHPHEAAGLAPLEAAHAGCVPLMAETCSLAEWLVHGVHCIKAQRTPEAFARLCSGVLEGTIDLESLARRLTAAVRRDFHLDAIIPTIERALIRARSRQRGPAGAQTEAYRMALLAEKLSFVLTQESLSA